MTEKLLQYIWQFQHYNANALTTIDGQQFSIIHHGNLNTNQGPDFSDAKIKIENTTWVGNVELHIKSSDWNLHEHSKDENYKNVVLHVVWMHDKVIKDVNGNNLPTLELQSRISKILLDKYEALMSNSFFIPCENQIISVNELTFTNFQHRLVAERLQDKSNIIFKFLKQNNFHWEETFWWLIAKNFGIKQNMEAFESIAQSIPLSILIKHKNQIHQLEALLFGQAGLLEKTFTEEYPLMLQKEYLFYKNKYKLQPPQSKIFFLRMRPANFPTIRLAQLAMIIHKSNHLFSKIIDEEDISVIKKLLNVTANDYWHYHYVFDETSLFKKKKLGNEMLNNILINTIIPILFTYGMYHDNQLLKDKAILWLEKVKAEKNVITKGFESLSVKNKNSFHSQSLIQLKNNYCNHKRCIECAVGNFILKTNNG